MKYSKQELIKKYAAKLVENEHFVNYWLSKRYSLYDCYKVISEGGAQLDRFMRMSADHLLFHAIKELIVLLTAFEAQEQDGMYDWTKEYYEMVCHWLDELTARES